MPQLTPIRAFVNTPVTQHVIVLLATCSLVLSVFYAKHYGSLSINPHILVYRQYWRIFTSQISVANESDLLVCTLLFFHFKTLERFFGSVHYAALLSTFSAYTAVLTFLAMCSGQLAVLGAAALISAPGGRFHISYFDTWFNSVAPGPLALLSSLYICHGRYVPTLYTFRIVLRRGSDSDGVFLTLTNHFQVHALYAVLLFNHGFASLLPCLVGAVVGRLYTQNLLVGPGACLSMFGRVAAWKRLPAGYVPISRSSSPNAEDDEIAIDDLTSPAAVRSASPPRPLRRQFLDTFLP